MRDLFAPSPRSERLEQAITRQAFGSFERFSTVPDSVPIPLILWTLRSDDGDVNGNATKTIGLVSKTTILHVHYAFLYISLPSLHDYDVKMPNFTMYRGSTQATTKFPLSCLLNLDMVLRNSTLGGFAYI